MWIGDHECECLCKGLGLYFCEREKLSEFEYVCTVLTVVCVCVLGDCVRERE